ncbi:helix-turn-helix domain-containing protein [Shimia sp.]|uniref:helix-turn-helix domain-containing protein n=1 Tax=Shimia sp. TaxID=1954381 RepID=UPI0032986129
MNDLWWRHQFVSNNNILVFHEGADLNCLSGPDFNNFCLSIDETYVERVAEREHIRLPALHRRPEVFRPAPALYARALHLAQACVLQASEATVSAVTDITDHLTVSWVLHAGIHQGARHERAHERALRQSLELIGDTPHQQHTVAELCRIAGTSRRTLETAFRDHLGVSPAAFMKLRRLSGARQDLKRRTSNSARVGDIMARHGFSHVGQFATDYRAAFGERPSDTLNNVN